MRVHNRRRISRQKYTVLFKGFVADVVASKASEIAGVNRKTGDRYYSMFRLVIVKDAISERFEIDL